MYGKVIPIRNREFVESLQENYETVGAGRFIRLKKLNVRRNFNNDYEYIRLEKKISSGGEVVIILPKLIGSLDRIIPGGKVKIEYKNLSSIGISQAESFIEDVLRETRFSQRYFDDVVSIQLNH